MRLSCSVLDPSASPTFVYWYRDDNVLNYSPTVDILENLNLRQFQEVKEEKRTRSAGGGVAGRRGGRGGSNMGKMAKARLPTVNELVSQEEENRKKSETEGEEDDSIVSTLSIDNVSRQHSGNYTCAPSNARQVSIMVHVVDGKKNAKCEVTFSHV